MLSTPPPAESRPQALKVELQGLKGPKKPGQHVWKAAYVSDPVDRLPTPGAHLRVAKMLCLVHHAVYDPHHLRYLYALPRDSTYLSVY